MVFPSYIDNAGSDWDKEVEEVKALALAHMPRAGRRPPVDPPIQPASLTVYISHSSRSYSKSDCIQLSEGMDFESTPRGPRAPSHNPRSSSSTTHYATPMSTPQEDHLLPEDSRTTPQTLKRPASPEHPSSPPVRTPKRSKKGKERKV
jgi:hypothetical protein